MSWAVGRLWDLLPNFIKSNPAGIPRSVIEDVSQNELQRRLEGLSPVIERILKLSGTAGASVGVLHMDEVVFTKGFGYRDIESKIQPDKDTMYYIASLSKFMTAAGLGILVEDGKLGWNDLVSEALPDFQHCNSEVRQRVNLLDILSHRTGLAQKMFAWMGEHSRPQQIGDNFIRTTTYLESMFGLRSTFISNNWLYGVAALIIERLSRRDFGRFLESNFFKPLNMNRTLVHSSPDGIENFAEAYMYDEDSPYHVHKPPIEVGATMEGAVGVKSSVHDLLIYYRNFLKAVRDQCSHNLTSSSGSPFKQVPELLTSQITMDGLPSAYSETSYTLGWAQTRLPTALGALGGNVDLVAHMPRIGENLERKTTVLYHSGSLVGYLSSVILLPNTDSAIIVLTNTLSNQDSADWISQVLLESILDVPHPNDYITLAEEAAATYKTFFPKMHNALAEQRKEGTSMRKLDLYVGQYSNQVGTFLLDIYLDDGDLCLSLNGYRPEKHKLHHYYDDTFSFEMTYQDCLRREMWPKVWKNYYLLIFGSDGEGNITCITWRPDWAVPDGELFTKRGISYYSPPGSDHKRRQDDKTEL